MIMILEDNNWVSLAKHLNMSTLLPGESRVAVFQGPGKGFSIETFSIPRLKPGELLVKVNLCTVCGSDLHTYLGHRPGPVPGALGHEIAGRLIAAGLGFEETDYNRRPLSPGDRITWLLYSFNPADPMSQKGYPQKSAGMFKYGHEPITPENALHTGFADYIILKPGTPVFKIPPSLSNLVATPVNCTLATAMAAVRLTGGVFGKKVAVFGCGMLGYYTMAISNVMGASTVLAVDANPDRLKNAKRFGANMSVLFNDLKKEAFDVVFEMSGAPEAMQKAAGMLGIGGIAVFAGASFPQKDFRLNGETIVRNLITIRGVHNYLPEDLDNSLKFMVNHNKRFPFSELIEVIFSLDQINEAFSYAISQKPVRIAINPNE